MKTQHLYMLPLLVCLPLTAKAQDQSAILGLQSVEVIKGWRQADKTHVAAVHIKLEKGWKTYWRVAGAGGIPPQFHWDNSTNVESVSIKWPSPNVFFDYGIRTIGYKDELILPLVFTPKDKSQQIKIDGSISFGICSDVCVPVESKLLADLPTRVAIGKSTIKAALKKEVPDHTNSKTYSVTCSFTPFEGGFEISTDVTRQRIFAQDAISIIEYPTAKADWLAQGKSISAGHQVKSNAKIYSKTPAFFDRSKLRLTILENGKSVELNGCVN